MNLTRKDFFRLAAGSVVVAGAGTLAKAMGGGDAAPPVPVPDDKKRWGMAIDTQKCNEAKGCDVCARACRLAHNIPLLPDPAHEVKWIWNEPAEKVFPFQQSSFARRTVSGDLPVLCNHCADPACVRVCPTQATWKRGDGVVMMDYHRCIGCRYCMAGCPYGSRSFNYRDPRPYLETVNPDFPTRAIGVVEKCNFCEERLVEGRLPACVAACPQQAMFFGDLNDENSVVRTILRRRYAVQRQPELGCGPSLFYLV